MVVVICKLKQYRSYDETRRVEPCTTAKVYVYIYIYLFINDLGGVTGGMGVPV